MAVTNVSDRFFESLRRSHEPICYAEVWYDGDRVIPSLQIEGGEIQMSANDLLRSNLQSLVCLDKDMSLLPDTPRSLLGVEGHEIHVYRGIKYSDEEQETVLLGKFRVQDHAAEESWVLPEGLPFHSGWGVDTRGWEYRGAKVTVSGMDRSANIVDGRFITPIQPEPGNTVLDEVLRLAGSGDNQIIEVDQGNWGGPQGLREIDKPTPSSITYQEDRADAFAQLAGSIDCRVFVSREGKLRLEKIEEAPNALSGSEILLPPVLAVSTRKSRDGIYNAVVARGEQAENAFPVQAVYYDEDFSNKTNWGSPFGRVPYFFSSPILGTTQAAQLAAETRMKNLIKGYTRQYSLSVIPDPTLDVNDVVLVSLPGRPAFPGVISSISIPLDSIGLMSLEVIASASATAAWEENNA